MSTVVVNNANNGGSKSKKRQWIYAKKPQGTLYKKRQWVGYTLLLFLFVAPFIKVNGEPFLMFNIIERKFSIFGNLSSDVLNGVPEGFRAQFNTPKYRSNLGLSNTGFGPDKRFGFNINWRWQQGFFYDGDFASGDLPAVNTVDAQISFKLPAIKSMIKIGGNNILNQYYYNGLGNPQIGGLYYVSFGYNIY